MTCRICGAPFSAQGEPVTADPVTGEERVKVVVCMHCGEISIVEATVRGSVSREPTLAELANITTYLRSALVELREERAKNPPSAA